MLVEPGPPLNQNINGAFVTLYSENAVQ